MNPTPNPIAATDFDSEPARKLYVQLVTRVATQTLHYRSGDEETAAKSVSNLFAATRELLEKNPKALAFEIAALAMLNDVVRPYTARWHGWMVNENFRGEAVRRKFRAELQQLQPALQHFRDLFQKMVATPALIADAAVAVGEITDAQAHRVQLADQGGPVVARIGAQVAFASGVLPAPLGALASAADIDAAEHALIRQRRAALGFSHPQDSDMKLMNATALCLSGGGIRSATFCLGIVQVLVRQGIFGQLDYLSTVSGGGYLGTFLSSYLGTPEPPPEPHQKQPADAKPAAAAEAPAAPGEKIRRRIADAFETHSGRESAAVRHLRNNSRYLISGGLAARARVIGLLLTGVATNLLLILPIPLLAALGMKALIEGGYWEPLRRAGADGGAGGSPAQIVPGVLGILLAMLWFLLPATTRAAEGAPPLCFRSRLNTFWISATILTGVAAIATLALSFIPWLFDRFHHLGEATVATARAAWVFDGWQKVATVAGFIAPFLLGPIAARLKAGTGKNVFIGLFALSGPLLCLLIFFIAGDHIIYGPWEWRNVALVAAAVTLWGVLLIDINNLSPRGYYRDRLCDCYLAAPGTPRRGLVRRFLRYCLHGRTGEDASRTAVRPVEHLPLSQLNETRAAPYHLIHATVNLPASREPNLRGRQSDFFTFSREFCGGPVCGYFRTKNVLEQLDPHVDAGTAMAISGAAASSNMGVKTMAQFRFLLALLNVRLGYWLRRPQSGPGRFDAPGPMFLFREMIGWMHEKSRYLNVSDGGHIENLALYEMLRRRCKYVVVVDGGQEPTMECADLMLAQRYAAIDLGVRLEFDLSDLALNDQGQTRAYAVLGKIHYDDGALGWLVYIKLACTGEEPGYVLDYRRQNRDFPHQSTGDQIYDEGQFEAYRRLGETAADSLFREELAERYFGLKPGDRPAAGAPTFSRLEQWFAAMATNFLPDNDDAFPFAPPMPPASSAANCAEPPTPAAPVQS